MTLTAVTLTVGILLAILIALIVAGILIGREIDDNRTND